MFDLGLTLTRQAIRRQLAAMPCELYLVRLIHNLTKRPFPGERLWTSTQLANLATIRFLRVGSQSFLRLRLGTLVSAVAFSAAHLLALLGGMPMTDVALPLNRGFFECRSICDP